MEIRNQLSFNSQYLSANTQKQSGQAEVSVKMESREMKQEALEKKSNKASYAPDLKEIANEMLSESEKLGTFKNKQGLEEATDVEIGPDIRFALHSKNPDFLRRILWGPLTVAEYREVKYRLREINQLSLRDSNVTSGKIIGEEELKGKNEKAQAVNNAEITVNISI